MTVLSSAAAAAAMKRRIASASASFDVFKSSFRQSTAYAGGAASAPPPPSSRAHVNPFGRALRWYGDRLETHPLLTKGLTAGVIGASGDALCQYHIDRPEKVAEMRRRDRGTATADPDNDETTTTTTESALWWFEPERSGRFFVLGVALVGPWCHAWFGWLATTFPKSNLSSVAVRVALDQLAFTPIILSTFVSSLWTMEHFMDGSSTDDREPLDVGRRLNETLPSLWATNVAVWTPVQLVNFGFVSQRYQVLFANVVSLAWNAYISFSTRANTTATEAAVAVIEAEEEDRNEGEEDEGKEERGRDGGARRTTTRRPIIPPGVLVRKMTTRAAAAAAEM